jgi:hypothetical protein
MEWVWRGVRDKLISAEAETGRASTYWATTGKRDMKLPMASIPGFPEITKLVD